jgi:hypothetical protein
MQQLTSSVEQTRNKTEDKEWLKILTLACSVSGAAGEKSPWEMADLALTVINRWKEHPRYNS